MSRSYGVKRDFGFQKEGAGGVFLPDQHESGVASPSKSTDSYRSTMPAYDDHSHKGRGVHGKLAISSGAEKETGLHVQPGGVSSSAARDAESYVSGQVTSPTRTRCDESESSRKKKSRGWFGGRKNTKKSRGVSDGVIDGVVEGKNAARSSPVLHARSAMRSGDKDQFGRPQTVPDDEGDEEVRMQLSYDAPVDITKGKLNRN